MTDDITDTGPLKWSRPRMSRAQLTANIIIGICVGTIITLLIMWGGR